MSSPTVTGSAASVLVRLRSAAAMSVSSLSLSLLASVSIPAALALAELVIVPDAAGVTTMDILTVLPLAMSLRVQVTTPPDSTQAPPSSGTAETKVTLPGSVSVTTTSRAVSGPLLVTATLYVTSSPRLTGSAESVLTTARSNSGTSTGVTVGSSSVSVSGSLERVSGLPSVVVARPWFCTDVTAGLIRFGSTCIWKVKIAVELAGMSPKSTSTVLVAGTLLSTKLPHTARQVTLPTHSKLASLTVSVKLTPSIAACRQIGRAHV